MDYSRPQGWSVKVLYNWPGVIGRCAVLYTHESQEYTNTRARPLQVHNAWQCRP